MQPRLFVLLFIAMGFLNGCSAPATAPAGIPTAPVVILTQAPVPTAAPLHLPTAALPANVPQLTPVPPPREIAYGKSYVNVHYCTDGTLPLTMIVIVPKNLQAPAPVLVHLKFQSDLLRPLVERGFIVVNIDWREPPAAKLPIGVGDVKCAIRYLRANADVFQLDPERIGVFGCSRGGHMGAMVGLTDSNAGMEGPADFAGVSSRVQAVATFDGIANFKTNYADAPGELNEVHGISSFDDPLVARLSPITYASPDDPEFLIIASEAEGWHAQAQELKAALDAVHVPATYIPAQGATHCNFSEAGLNTKENMTKFIGDFFERTLK